MTGPTLVTGAAGFAGSHLLDQLTADGVETIGWHRPGGRPPRALPGVRWQGVDLLEPRDVRSAIERLRPSHVFHCAGAAHVGQSWSTAAATLRVNVMGTHHLVEALRGVVPEARLLITSSALVYGPSSGPIDENHALAPANPYGLSKIAQELVGTAGGGHAATFIARPFNHFGPRQDASFVSAAFAKQIAEIEAGLAAPEIHVGNLEALRDLTDVRDTVRAYRLLVDHGVPFRPYNICTGTAIRVRSLLDTLVALAHVNVSVVPDPARYRPNDTPVVLGDASRARVELGWEPRIPPEQTANDLLQYWRWQVRQA
ncbi:MAG TPA: GDP-mannose 4,6-dehydratase [Vicinamibacterales bacterium]|nr:GDP-mannose 4,6-dehydratase [Vicinamibacterales bacterium]